MHSAASAAARPHRFGNDNSNIKHLHPSSSSNYLHQNLIAKLDPNVVALLVCIFQMLRRTDVPASQRRVLSQLLTYDVP